MTRVPENAKKNAIIIDFSTIGTPAAQEIAQKLKEYSLRFMDAPVSGGDVGAQNGTLTIMVGGQKTDFDKCLPILQAVGETVIYCGAVGSGQAVKLCNQILCAVYTHSSSKSLKAVFLGMGSDTRMCLSLVWGESTITFALVGCFMDHLYIKLH
jgi:3-hydroxyisobutyrate dehydrogenase